MIPINPTTITPPNVRIKNKPNIIKEIEEALGIFG
jgi:hypothetical protein